MQSLEARIETKGEFYDRVFNNLEKLCLHRKPYDVTRGMVDTVWNVLEGRGSDDYKARLLLCWIMNRTKYNKDVPYTSASETFRLRKGKCVDLSILYAAMAKIAGLDAGFVMVDRDKDDRKVSHACSYVYLDGKLVLVDPAYKKFNLNHTEFVVLDNESAHDYYVNVMVNCNKGKGIEAGEHESRLKKKYGVVFYHESRYNQRDLEYIRRAKELFGEERPSFFKRVAENVSSRIISSFLLRGLKYAGVTAVLGLTVNHFTDFFDEAEAFIENNPIVQKLEEYKRERRLDNFKERNFYKLVGVLKKHYPDDPRLNNDYSEENYKAVTALFFDYYKGSLHSAR